MDINKSIKVFLLALFGLALFALSGEFTLSTCLAADDTNTDKTDEQTDEDLYKLDYEVQEWLDEGGSIPNEAKYASLSGTGHLWWIVDKDFSDGRIELDGNGESRILYGLKLRDWLKSQSFFGENFGQKDNKIKFKRPKKNKAF